MPTFTRSIATVWLTVSRRAASRDKSPTTSKMPPISSVNVTTYPVSTGKGTPIPARPRPKFAGPI